jgi:hypothetical protein
VSGACAAGNENGAEHSRTQTSSLSFAHSRTSLAGVVLLKSALRRTFARDAEEQLAVYS